MSGAGFATLGRGQVKSACSVDGQNGLICSYRYHWRFVSIIPLVLWSWTLHQDQFF